MIDIVIPHSADDLTRNRNLFFVIKYLKNNLPDSNIIIVEQNTETDISTINDLVNIHLKIKVENNLFCKSLLLNEGYNVCNNKYIIFNDNDCIIDVKLLQQFNDLFEILDKHLILPYNKPVINLSENQTVNFINNMQIDYTSSDLIRRGWVSQGGVVMISSDNYYKIGGHDPRFIGWGGEDDAFYFKSLELIGVVRTNNELIHLNHPRVGGNQNPHYNQNLQYYNQYLNKHNIINIVNEIGFKHLKK